MDEIISVVLPVRDGGEYLAAAVDSILSQTFQNIELLVVDDHSEDAAIDSLDKSDPRLRVVPSKGHGLVNACNTGFARSRGRFVARMDADDISLPDRLACQLGYLQDMPEVGIAGCCVEIFSAKGIRGGLARYQNWLNSVRTPLEVHHQIFIESPLPNPGVMFRREVLQQLGGYRTMQWPEDYDLWLRADAAGIRMGKPDPVLLRWREHEKRLTHTDTLYERHRFMQAKTHFLVQQRLGERGVIIWGAGPTGRQIHDLIVDEGGCVEGFIEVHPRRIGGKKRGLPVWSMEKVTDTDGALLLIAVGAAGARQKIAEFLHTHAKSEGQDYLFVA